MRKQTGEMSDFQIGFSYFTDIKTKGKLNL